jgi:hypothetical protein
MEFDPVIVLRLPLPLIVTALKTGDGGPDRASAKLCVPTAPLLPLGDAPESLTIATLQVLPAHGACAAVVPKRFATANATTANNAARPRSRRPNQIAGNSLPPFPTRTCYAPYHPTPNALLLAAWLAAKFSTRHFIKAVPNRP